MSRICDRDKVIDMKRILICTTILTTVKAFLIPHIRLLQDMGYSVDVAGNKDVNELDEIVDNVYDIPYQRSPFSKQNIKASRQLKEIVRKNNYCLIHFHTPIASAFGRWTVRGFRKSGTKVIYTAHGFHFYKGAPFKNWLLYYPVERFLSRYTDMLITINKEDYVRAQTFKAKKVDYVPGVGLDVEKLVEIMVDRDAKRAELGVSDDAIALLSIGELNENKNHETVIRAIAKLEIPNICYVICGDGELKPHLKELSASLGIENKVSLLGFRTDLSEIYQIVDLFIFPSLREGLSVSLMEAMAAGLPVVCSNIRGNSDLIKDGKGGYLVKPNDVDGFAEAIEKVIFDSNSMGLINTQIIKHFDIVEVTERIKKIYGTV